MMFLSDPSRENYDNYELIKKYDKSGGTCSNIKSKIKSHPVIFASIIIGIIILIIIISVAIILSNSSKNKKEDNDDDGEYTFNISEKSKKEVLNIYNNIGSNDDNDLTTFCNYLSSQSSNLNDEQKVYLAYYWIAKNIKYDYEGLDSDTVIYDPDKFFPSKKTVCSGYARLFRRLLTSMNYDKEKIKNIQGYAKGASYSVYKDPEANHEWNAVDINGHWCLIDTTWDADKNTDQFYYLCTRPSCFVRDHLPAKTEYQFIDNPITLEEFHNMAWTNGRFCYFKGQIIEDKSFYKVCGKGQFFVKYKVDFDTKLTINPVNGVSLDIKPINSGFQVDFSVDKEGEFELSMFLLNYDLNYEFIGKTNLKCQK